MSPSISKGESGRCRRRSWRRAAKLPDSRREYKVSSHRLSYCVESGEGENGKWCIATGHRLHGTRWQARLRVGSNLVAWGVRADLKAPMTPLDGFLLEAQISCKRHPKGQCSNPVSPSAYRPVIELRELFFMSLILLKAVCWPRGRASAYKKYLHPMWLALTRVQPETGGLTAFLRSGRPGLPLKHICDITILVLLFFALVGGHLCLMHIFPAGEPMGCCIISSVRRFCLGIQSELKLP